MTDAQSDKPDERPEKKKRRPDILNRANEFQGCPRSVEPRFAPYFTIRGCGAAAEPGMNAMFGASLARALRRRNVEPSKS